ncbi:MAG: ABC transporter ATP-binding protein [Thermaerobacter sp.]|nr:ABC transporter ATP-binding protein [Thermaerobacter sp.]
MKLSVDGVARRHAPGFQLGPLSVAVDRGEWLGIVGPNGAGKTTLLRIMAGTEPPDVGRVRYDERALAQMGPVARSHARAVVPQRLTLPFDLSVASVVELGRLSHLPWGERLLPLASAERILVEACLEQTDTWGLRDRSFRTLSGGEQQRVLLAMALAQGAPLLLLDEPTASLDPGHARQFLELVGTLVADGHTVVMAHHDLTTVAQACSSVLLLADGQVEAYGGVDEVFQPEPLSGVYRTPLGVMPHPVTGRPLVFHRQ